MAIPWVEAKTRIVFAESQQEAARLALSSKVLVITGGPGVGKTTLIDAILMILRAKHVSAALCAPTGRAAKRLSESTGLEAKTIHRLRETDPKTGGFRRTEQHALACDLLRGVLSTCHRWPLSRNGNILVLHRGAYPRMEFESNGALVRAWGDGMISEGRAGFIPQANQAAGRSRYSAVYRPAGCRRSGQRTDPRV